MAVVVVIVVTIVLMVEIFSGIGSCEINGDKEAMVM